MFVFLCLNKHNTWLDICMLLFFILDLNMKVITTSLTWKPILERLWKKRLGGRISCPEMKASVPLLSLFCKTAPFPMKKWPYKRGGISWEDFYPCVMIWIKHIKTKWDRAQVITLYKALSLYFTTCIKMRAT